MKNLNLSGLSGAMQYQLRIYLEGSQNKRPVVPVAFEDLENMAKAKMKPEVFGYIAGGAGGESTMENNKKAFENWQIIPRMMGDVSGRDTSVELFGTHIASPVLLAPIGVLSIAHPEAEVAVARAAHALHIPQILSTVSSKSLEEVATANGSNPHWFQLYWGRNDEFTRSLIRRAEKAGYSAIVVTLDTRLFAWRERDIQNAYLPFLYNEGLTNYMTDPVFQSLIKDAGNSKLQVLLHFASCFSNPASTWNDFSVIRDSTNLPVIVKGILHPGDARKAVENGADGIIVSNHGGRQCDGAAGALDVLEDIVNEVGEEAEILFDSGIRRGADVFKAIALGAKAVLFGRPYAYALALAGEHGVMEVTANLLADVDLTLGLTGCRSWKEVSKNSLRRRKE